MKKSEQIIDLTSGTFTISLKENIDKHKQFKDLQLSKLTYFPKLNFRLLRKLDPKLLETNISQKKYLKQFQYSFHAPLNVKINDELIATFINPKTIRETQCSQESINHIICTGQPISYSPFYTSNIGTVITAVDITPIWR
jgi:hypothetical protein